MWRRMRRRLSILCLLGAWVCASGILLNLEQGVAWVRMFNGYAKSCSVSTALQRTFDPEKPCAICRAVERAQEAAQDQQPAAVSPVAVRLLLICGERSAGLTPAAAVAVEWPAQPAWAASAPYRPVPLPPPRAA